MRWLPEGLWAHRMVDMNDDAIETACQKSLYFIELTTMDAKPFVDKSNDAYQQCHLLKA